MNAAETFSELEQCLAIIEIESAMPKTGSGQCAARQIAGERVVVEAEIFGGEPDALFVVIKFRPENMSQWSEVPMQFRADNRWHGEFVVTTPGCYVYTIEAWVDHFKTWRHSLLAELNAGRNISIEALQAGVQLIEAVMSRATAPGAERLEKWAEELRSGNSATGSPLTERALDGSLAKLMAELTGRQPGRRLSATPEKELHVIADPR